MVHRLLVDPVEFIDERSKKKQYKEGFIFTLFNSVLMGAAMLLIDMLMASNYTFRSAAISFLTGVSVMLLIQYFSSYLIWEFLRFIKKNTSYFAILSLIGYTFFYVSMSVSFTIMLLPFPFVNLFSPFIGIVLMMRAAGVFFRFLKDYAGVSLIESFVIFFMTVVSVAVWINWVFEPLSLFL